MSCVLPLLAAACMLPETKASKNTERQLINAAGDTVLHTAVRAQAREALEVLLVQIRSGQLLQARDAEGLTAAELAAQQNDARRTGDTTCLKQQQSMLQLFRLKGKGMPVLRSSKVGDMYIQVVVETPQNLTRRQRELLEEFEKESSAENNPESSGFFTRVKDFLEGLGT